MRSAKTLDYAVVAYLHRLTAFGLSFVLALQGGKSVAPSETARILGGKGSPPHRSLPPSQSEPPTADGGTYEVLGRAFMNSVEGNRGAYAAVLRIIDAYAFQSGAASGSGGGSNTSMPPMTDAKARTAAAPTFSSVVPAAPVAPDVILVRASILAEALCVWGCFGLPLAPLEASLRPRLDDRDNARVLTTVFFPQICPDVTLNRATSRGQTRVAAVVAAGGGDWGGQNFSGGGTVLKAASLGPTPSQIEAASGLGLSASFLLALTRAGGKLSASPASPELCRPTEDVADGGHRSPVLGSQMHLGVGLTATTAAQPSSSSSFSALAPGISACNSVGPRTSAPAPLTLLLEHRAGVRKLASSVRFAPALSADGRGRESGRGGTPMSEVAERSFARSSRPLPDARDQAVAWSGAGPAAGACAPTNNDEDTVWFSCGRRYSRDHLLRTVVPACVSRIRHATSSLPRTQQALALEYEGRNAAAACPECAVKELGRLVAGLRPAAVGTGVVVGGVSTGGVSPPP